jgi:hypothetical protein
MNESQHIQSRLWNYIDGNIGNEEKVQVEQLLQNNAAWQNAYKQLLEIDQLVKAKMELDEPSMRFTKNVMEQIFKLQIAPATKTYINKKIVYGIAAFFVIMIGGLLIYSFTQINWSATGNNTSPFNLSKLNFSKYFSKQFLNIFLMLNIVLGLILFDRYLVKQNNKSKHKEV